MKHFPSQAAITEIHFTMLESIYLSLTEFEVLTVCMLQTEFFPVDLWLARFALRP